MSPPPGASHTSEERELDLPVLAGIAVLPTDQLRPPCWNLDWAPTARPDQEVVEEIRRHGWPARAILVLKRGQAYEIIDGIQLWKAARTLGVTEILCEVYEFVRVSGSVVIYHRTHKP